MLRDSSGAMASKLLITLYLVRCLPRKDTRYQGNLSGGGDRSESKRGQTLDRRQAGRKSKKSNLGKIRASLFKTLYHTT